MSENNLGRRSVLKNVGAAAAGFTVAGAGQAAALSSCYESLDIRVWPAYDNQLLNDYPEAYDIEDSLQDFVGQLEDADAIGTGTVTVNGDSINGEFGIGIGTENDGCTYTGISDFQSAIYDSNYDDDVHVIVSGQSNFASASHGDNNAYLDDDDSAEVGTGFAWVGTDGPYPGTNEPVERYKNLAIQEVGHVIIKDEYGASGTDQPDHSLGEIKKANFSYPVGYTGPATPMTTYYEDEDDHNPCYDLGDAAHQGDCDAASTWNGSHVRQVTGCTIAAVKETCNKEGY